MPPVFDVTDPLPLTLTERARREVAVAIVACAWAGAAVSRSTMTFAAYVPAAEYVWVIVLGTSVTPSHLYP